MHSRKRTLIAGNIDTTRPFEVKPLTVADDYVATIRTLRAERDEARARIPKLEKQLTAARRKIRALNRELRND
jgi:hypothetical protein